MGLKPRREEKESMGGAEGKGAQGPAIEPPARSAEELLHELRVHQIELETQNEELRRIQAALEESRDGYIDLYELAPVGYLTLTRETRIAAINLTGATLLGEDRRKLLDRRFARFVAPADADRWHRFFFNTLQQQDRQSCELEMQRGDGSCFHVRMDCLRPQGESPGVRVTLTDITERRHAEEELRIAAIAFESEVGMIVTDPQAVIVRVNRAFTRLTGYRAEEAIGRTPSMLSSGRHDREFFQRMWRALLEGGHWQGEIWNRRRDGKHGVEWLTISAVKSPDGATSHYVGAFSEITQKKEAEAEIHRLAYFDPLTNLPNRQLLHDRIRQAMAISGRSGHHGALIFLDLDHFKNLNDTRGHDVGDQLLVETAQRIQSNLREGDTVARLGGDEFVVMLEGLSAEAREAAVQTDLVGEKLRQALARPYDLGRSQFHCSASLGAALFRGHEESIKALLRHADLAMYKAKSAGRNTLRFFDPAMQTSLDQRSALESDLRLAVERGQLQLYYQAQIDGARRILGAEALLRWVHPERGLVLPGHFIAVAEDTDLIQPIGRWVLEAACAQIKAWSADASTRELKLAINVSARQFRRPEFAAQVEQALAQTGADPTRLKIELTESIALENVIDTIDRMHALKALGVGFCMDDFGTGFSSLSYLKRLPVDQLKIDRVFVRDLASDPNDAAIVQMIVTMGKTLGLDVIAEGVETQAQLERLCDYGCVAFQGYLFAGPLPLADFEQYVRRNVTRAVIPDPATAGRP
jgi:diguanylate cyclase (GGDEF)-like protein/PAS domain S-box-containing protein